MPVIKEVSSAGSKAHLPSPKYGLTIGLSNNASRNNRRGTGQENDRNIQNKPRINLAPGMKLGSLKTRGNGVGIKK